MEQADLFVGRESLAGRRQSETSAAGVAQADAQHSLAPPELDAHSFHAGQVGVSLVCGLGPGISVHHAGAGRSRVRQGKSVGAAVRTVPASQRPDSGVRMGVFRSESARARLGLLARLPDGEAAHRQGRHRLPGKMSAQAADELRLVGEPGRQRRQQRFRRRISGLGQYRGGRSRREVSQRRHPGTVRCHRLDGFFLSLPDAHRAGTGQAESGL